MSGGHAPVVLFLCIHNAGRSQMAAALLERRAGGRIVVHTAGSDPSEALHAAVVAAMAEVDIDISERKPTQLTDDMVHAADLVVTMGCGDTCPIYPGQRYEDWEVADPAGLALRDVRPIRDEIARRVDALAARLVASGANS